MNFLEQLAAEWYEYKGYFVRSNVRARKRDKGGWDLELDVLALQPATSHLIHVETSGDAMAWEKRKRRFLTKKFVLTTQEYEKLVGVRVKKVEKVAVVGYSRKTSTDLQWAPDIRVLLIPEFLQQITRELRHRHPMQEAVPEGFPILRTIQTVIAYGLEDV